MNCGHDCFLIGGPWIAENPNCPIHGANRKEDLDENALLQILVSVWEGECPPSQALCEILELIGE